MSNEPCIAITIKELERLIRAPEQIAKDLMDARERLLKLEYKYKELIDILTDLRAHQVMNATEAPIIKVNVTKQRKSRNDNI